MPGPSGITGAQLRVERLRLTSREFRACPWGSRCSRLLSAAPWSLWGFIASTGAGDGLSRGIPGKPTKSSLASSSSRLESSASATTKGGTSQFRALGCMLPSCAGPEQPHA